MIFSRNMPLTGAREALQSSSLIPLNDSCGYASGAITEPGIELN